MMSKRIFSPVFQKVSAQRPPTRTDCSQFFDVSENFNLSRQGAILLDTIGSDVLLLNRSYIKICGHILPAAWLSNALAKYTEFMTGTHLEHAKSSASLRIKNSYRVSKEGIFSFYLPIDECILEIGMRKMEQISARNVLKKLGILSESHESRYVLHHIDLGHLATLLSKQAEINLLKPKPSLQNTGSQQKLKFS